MTDTNLRDASCRVALAALLHDLGKFAERAGLEADQNTIEANQHLYCPFRQESGYFTHKHAAYTAIALDWLEKRFPELKGEDVSPFGAWQSKDVADSFINAAAAHHRPETFLQWIIATADRVASGFEREEFERYNAAIDETRAKKNHYTARLLTLFEQIDLVGGEAMDETRLRWRYPLKPLSPNAIFPVEAKGYEKDNNDAAREEYKQLWKQFDQALNAIPRSHRKNLALWLDHFDTLWLIFTHAIPAATAFNVKPEVSLYDHSKTTAALAVALWRYHHENKHHPGEKAAALRDRSDWDERKILLVQGDFFGIQDFIFATGGETQRRAAKLLRGRSFYVSLLTECAALKILDKLDLPSTSQIVNAAGKFLIVAPHTEATIEKLKVIQTEINAWFLEHTYGQSGIGFAWLPAACNDFLRGKEEGTRPFQKLMMRLFEQLEAAKLKRFDLCGRSPAQPVFEGFLDRFDNEKGACAIDGRSPATEELGKDDAGNPIWVSPLAYDQVEVGRHLASLDRILITCKSLDHHTLRLPIFGYHVNFTAEEDITGKFGKEAESGNLVRAWDFSLTESSDAALWNGYARRYINAYVPRFGELSAYDKDRYEGLDKAEDANEIKTLNHLARDDWEQRSDGRLAGVEALMTLKGDVDNLGQIFQRGLETPTFAKMAALSRQMNAFFAIYLPWLCEHFADENGRKPFRNTYTVFSGGDDFFLIGPWRSTIRLAQRMRQDFERYIANPAIHFSAGLSMTKSGLPIRYLARLAEEALDEAKTHNPGNSTPAPKNAVTCYGIPVTWDDFESLMQREAALSEFGTELGLSSGYLYDLLRYTDMAEKVSERPENAIWHSHFAYRTRRILEANKRLSEDERKRWQGELAAEIVCVGIERHKTAYKIALFTHLYQQRD